jgi:transaldolase
MNLLQTLRQHGQSVWLDGLERNWILSGQLQRSIDNGLRGVTSNFTTLEQAIRAGSYDRDFQAIQHQLDIDAQWLHEYLMIQDMQLAADRMKLIHIQTHASDGFVNLDLPPQVTLDPQSTLTVSRRLWQAVGWSNLMLRMPATAATVSVIEPLISEGININVTKLFSQTVYEQVAEAYLKGLEALVLQGQEVNTIASVASVSINRLDKAFVALMNTPENKTDALLEGISLGIALAKVMYQQYQTIYHSDRWQTLARRGAQPQRLLWDITSFEHDLAQAQHYIESLVGAGTVLALDPRILQEYDQYSLLQKSLTVDVDDAHQTLEDLERMILLETLANRLLAEELERSQQSFNQLLRTIAQKRYL